ncbi:alpha-D-glucose-1-phosphate phosphatase YihX [Variibacter gotjawalensis]|uniref:Alpha-D-glucose-1-phosphate phosphatase YihX n=1 Tax=Variibacter gotjawalensis TaxID=1333996 RepID=A0A0S3PW48_9BRAD|nr:HAD family phosphatase [Variibacter gotjawalensis]NIK45838.1 putative hydrolase of the HAD superfamily [Variibacter gotjawalensis]RZS47762.1 putative hydrolase of the HAD superfamily [Variibacter gotjawalensis]BAT60016.1 alpha-D-glucose-1-phosphate phosphatase YihX [Variibacter gotjawalensis]
MIKNIIFDVGNVFVQWSPHEIVERSYQLAQGSDENLSKADTLFRNALWKGLNRGEMTMAEAQRAYRDQFALSEEEAERLFFHILDSLDVIEGTEALAQRLKAAGYRIFALTDNVHEIVAYLKNRHTFWPLFEAATISAELGLLKPEAAIYRHALDTHGLVGDETVFFDDIQANVDGAIAAGMHAKVFTTANRCEADLRELGVSV